MWSFFLSANPPDNRGLLSDQWVGSMYSEGKTDKGVIYVLGWTEPDGARFHYATQNRYNSKLMNCLFLKSSI